jgi:hypothetical protein
MTITVYDRTGKSIDELSMMEIVEEYQKINVESYTLIHTVLQMDPTEEQKAKMHQQCNDYVDYQLALAKEFIQRFMK